jgi:hypothetical protein
VGTIVPPGSVEIVTVPEALVEVEPEWRASISCIWKKPFSVIRAICHRGSRRGLLRRGK